MLQDIRYALRVLAQNRGFAAVAILSLALGIGANTAIFTLIDYVVLRSLPARSPDQLVVLARNPEKPSTSFNYPDYRYIRDHNQSYSGVLATGEGSVVAFAVPGEKGASAEVVPCARVSGNYFDVLGVPSAIGRLFTPRTTSPRAPTPSLSFPGIYGSAASPAAPKRARPQDHPQRRPFHHHRRGRPRFPRHRGGQP